MSAQILPFTNLPRGKATPRKALPLSSIPSVVILPCVRYERWGDETGEEATAAAVQFASAHH